MGNCPSKSKDEPFAIAMTPLTSAYLKKAWNGMQKTLCKVYCKQHVETWCKSIFTQSFKSSLIAVYDRFSLQSFNGSIQMEMFFMTAYFKCGYWKIRKEKKCFQFAGWYTEQLKMTNYIKDPQTNICTGLTSCQESDFVLVLVEINTTTIMVKLLLSVSCYAKTRHIISKPESDTTKDFAL